MPTAAELIRTASAALHAAGIETARLDAEVLLRHLMGLDRAQLFMRLRDPVPPEIATQFDNLIDQRLAGTPVAYLTGRREFMGLPFAVGPGVLVPRPETELLVEWAADRVRRTASQLIVDVGTGSGAIILSLAGLMPEADALMVGGDWSRDALAFAVRNRASLGLESRVHLVLGDLLTWLGRPADLVLANLPYLTPGQVETSPEIHAEPELALVSGGRGLDAIERLLRDSPRILAPGGAMILELDPAQADDVAELANQLHPAAQIDIVRDLAGFDRFVTIELQNGLFSRTR